MPLLPLVRHGQGVRRHGEAPGRGDGGQTCHFGRRAEGRHVPAIRLLVPARPNGEGRERGTGRRPGRAPPGSPPRFAFAEAGPRAVVVSPESGKHSTTQPRRRERLPSLLRGFFPSNAARADEATKKEGLPGCGRLGNKEGGGGCRTIVVGSHDPLRLPQKAKGGRTIVP